jgi:hypothetical protein
MEAQPVDRPGIFSILSCGPTIGSPTGGSPGPVTL